MLSLSLQAKITRIQSNWQAPGPPGWPQLWHASGISLPVAVEPVTAAKTDSFFRSSVL
jgi:hypothetical protein